MKKLLTIFLISILLSCNDNEKKHLPYIEPKVVETIGYIVPKDSMSEPTIIRVDETKLIKTSVGKPKIIPTNLNVHPLGEPKIILAGTPRICIPGKDSFLLPKIIPVIDSPFIAGIPETVMAKDMANKDQNPNSFSFYGRLQGLKAGSINCLLEDKFGNIWLGISGSGVAKYDGVKFTYITNKEGLSNNDVSSIIEDKSGNLWFGTKGGGVTKYDGKQFTHYTDRKGLCNNDIRSILEDKYGNIWFGTLGGGVSKYDGKQFTHFTEKEGLINNDVRSILEDKSGNIWFGSALGGISKYNGKQFINYTDKEGLSNNFISSMVEDKFGNIWFGTLGGGVSKYDGKQFTHFTEKEGLINNDVRSILYDRNGNIWFGTGGGGVSKYDGKQFTHFTNKQGLSDNFIWSILEDKCGNIWFGTLGGGVSKYDRKQFTHFTDKEGLNNSLVKTIIEDKCGNVWFAPVGGGVSKYDGKQFTNYTDKEGLSDNFISSMLVDKSENIWFGTIGKGVSKYDGKQFTNFTKKDGLINNDIRSMLEDKSGNIWFGSAGGGVSKYDGKQFTNFTNKEGLSNNFIWSMLEDKYGNIWFGTLGGGVSKYNGKQFTHFTKKEGLSSNLVFSMLEDNSGNIWFGTARDGVSKYDGKQLTHFTEKEGLVDNGVLSMLEDKAGNIWFGTSFGISKLTQLKLIELNRKIKEKILTEQDVIFKNYTYSDGFLGVGVAIGETMLQDKNGTIWIGASDRLTAMRPENMPPDTMAPNIQLTTIELFNENIAWADLEYKKDSTLTLVNGVNVSNFSFNGLTKWYPIPENLNLAYDNNYLTFNFIGITMNQPKNVRYQYKLEGFDENWSSLTNKTFAPYGNLQHGTYTFKVKAMNNDGYWSKPFEYKFTIRPPYWQTWWFRGLVGVFIFGSIIFYIKWRERKLKAEKVILEKTVKERTAEVVQQKHLIEEKHKEIKDSINYAERIQRSFLATKKHLDENLNHIVNSSTNNPVTSSEVEKSAVTGLDSARFDNYFILFKPKDIVSGDFYWSATLSNGTFALATADSTGHGVPGAIMSLLNITSLEKAIETYIEPSDILNATRKIIIDRLKKDGSEDGGKDGMDCSLCVYDFKNMKLHIAAANNPVWILRGGETIEIKPDKMPVGKHDKQDIPFTQQSIDLRKGDLVYTLTDGFPDQFGGENGKKFMSKKLRELLAKKAHLPLKEQKDLLEKTFSNWVGNLEQVDDITLIGVRV